MSRRWIKTICYGVSLMAFLAAGVYMLRGEDRALGAMGVIAAAILARVLILKIAEADHSPDQ